MGMNYYLRKKARFDPLHRLPATLGCMDGGENEPTELINGWVWNNRYYPTLEALNTDYYQLLHIGKSSAGWRFLLCTYPTENPRYINNDEYSEEWIDSPIMSLDDWKALFADPQNTIVDECGETIDPGDMVATIAERKPSGRHRDANGWHKLYEGTPRETEWEYLFVDGFLVHTPSRRDGADSSRYADITTVMPPGNTYDMVLSGNDPESVEVFS